MARSVDSIIEKMDTEQAAQTELASLNSTSLTAIYTLWKYIVSVALNLHEQLWDTFKTSIETQVRLAAPNTPYWWQQKLFEFQYSSTTPQALVLVDYVPQYATIDGDMRIITRASVKTDSNKTIQIKTAKSDPPSALSVSELAALQQYCDDLCPAGLQFNITSLPSDKLYIKANVYYDGQYSAVIQDNVESAVDAYLAGLPFDGQIKVSAIEDAIQNADGVVDVVIETIKARQDSVVLGSADVVFDLATGVNGRKWDSIAGYFVTETTVSNTISDTITYIVNA